MINYIMFVFGENENQDNTIQLIAQEISSMSHSNTVKYNYGKCAGIFTFNSECEVVDINDSLKSFLDESYFMYVLLPVNKDKMIENIPKPINNHLFNIFSKNENMIVNDDDYKFYQFYHNMLNLELVDNDEKEVLNNRIEHDPTMDQILDKIITQGISSLTTNDKSLLEYYSKTI